jgi:hypothetical protein
MSVHDVDEKQDIIDCLKHAIKLYEQTKDSYDLVSYIKEIISDYDE